FGAVGLQREVEAARGGARDQPAPPGAGAPELCGAAVDLEGHRRLAEDGPPGLRRAGLVPQTGPGVRGPGPQDGAAARAVAAVGAHTASTGRAVLRSGVPR